MYQHIDDNSYFIIKTGHCKTWTQLRLGEKSVWQLGEETVSGDYWRFNVCWCIGQGLWSSITMSSMMSADDWLSEWLRESPATSEECIMGWPVTRKTEMRRHKRLINSLFLQFTKHNRHNIYICNSCPLSSWLLMDTMLYLFAKSIQNMVQTVVIMRETGKDTWRNKNGWKDSR